jgi:hypothetical protein
MQYYIFSICLNNLHIIQLIYIYKLITITSQQRLE